MSNQERIKEYLVGKEKDGKHIEGYLEKELSNNKVIMLSGKWGSGKTHFWQNEIVPSLNNEKSKIPNHYISLYGKTSIEEIKSEIFLKVFESVDSFESEEKTKNIVKNSLDIVSSLTKTVSVFGMSLDLSKVTDKSFEKIDNLLDNEKLKRTEKYLNNGAIICIDDFERKSKDIDLNNLFGFITQLTLNFKCKVVIILNDDVFHGEEKAIFSNVKEKTVSKFLYYKPEIIELFNLIFEYDKRYLELKEYKELILNNLIASQEVNARIYIQIFENLLEFTLYIKDIKNESKYLKYFIFQNINFILNHKIFKLIKNEKSSIEVLDNIKNKNESINKCIEEIINKNWNYEKNYDVVNNLSFEQLPKNEINSIYFQVSLDCLIIKSKYEDRDMENYIINVIHNFIETGILIDE